MKIKKLEFSGHEVLGDLSIDFTDDSGKPLDVVVFIGDNGTGKTQVLKSIVDTIGYSGVYKDSAKIERSQGCIKLSKNSTHLIVDELRFDDAEYRGYSDRDSEYLGSNELDQKIIVWFPAELNVEQRKTNQHHPTLKLVEVADQWHFDEINDYIIDRINKAIYKDMSKPAKKVFDDESKEINTTFEDLDVGVKLIGLSGESGLPIFKNNQGDEMELKDLSSGEKQLFFRFLSLKRLNVNNTIIIVDEPETSLHPEWQRKIIKVYENIGENNQIIMATHSPLILGSVQTKGVRKLIRNEEGKIELESVDQTYGKSVEHLLKLTMDLDDVRDVDTAKKLNETSDMIKKGDDEGYNKNISILKEQLGTADKNIVRLELEKAIKEKQNAKS